MVGAKPCERANEKNETERGHRPRSVSCFSIGSNKPILQRQFAMSQCPDGDCAALAQIFYRQPPSASEPLPTSHSIKNATTWSAQALAGRSAFNKA